LISLTLNSIIREFKFDETSSIFDSIAVNSKGERLCFTRNIPLPVRWQDSKSFLNYTIELGTGEDPRAFLWKGVPCFSTIVYSYEHGYFNRLYHTEQSRWYNLIPPKNVISGKNWTPFTIGEDLYFLHEFSPFRIMKARPLNSVHDSFLFFDTIAELQTEIGTSVDNYCSLRGGSNGLLIKDTIFGFGHTNEYRGDKKFENIIHRPFLWAIKTGLEFNIEIKEPIREPFDDRYMIVDPTSFFIENNCFYMVTCETEYPWNVTRDQHGRICVYEVNNILD
jgi:hypothetical protein